MESFVTLSWSTAGSARRRWGGAWGRCAWWGWGGDYLEVVHRAHCHRLRVEANQSNRSLTPQPQYQLQVDWDGKSPTASHSSDEEKETKQSWQKLTFGVVAAISELAMAEEGGGSSFQNISKGFPKHSQPTATTFLFQSPDFRLINLVIVLLSDYSDLPNFPRSSWLHDNQSILANILIFFIINFWQTYGCFFIINFSHLNLLISAPPNTKIEAPPLERIYSK